MQGFPLNGPAPGQVTGKRPGVGRGTGAGVGELPARGTAGPPPDGGGHVQLQFLPGGGGGVE